MQNNQIVIIDRILSVPAIRRRRLQQDVQRHIEAQCNGDYWYDDDKEEWSNPKGASMEQSIINRIYQYTNGILGALITTPKAQELPDFISWHNDPRGMVLKIESDKLDEDTKQYCRDIRLLMDWGGDYGFLLNSEIKN